MSTLQNIRHMLEMKGFKNPIIYPVSARAGYLAKQFQVNRLTKLEERELYNYVDKFDQMCLGDYYTKEFSNIKIKDSEKEEIGWI